MQATTDRAMEGNIPIASVSWFGKNCKYRDPGDPTDAGLYEPIARAKDINSVAIGTLLDIFANRRRVLEAVAEYFAGVHTWFPIIDRPRLEQELEESWSNLPAETSVVVLCMTLIARPPAPNSNKGIHDAAYHTVKGTLSTVQSTVELSIPLVQSELLLALYEFTQNKPLQAYLSVGRCLHMTRVLGWHEPAFWCVGNDIAKAKELKRCSVLWWAMVYVDCLLNIGYQDQTFPMHTMGLAIFPAVPLPSTFDEYLSQFGAQDPADTVTFPETGSALSLINALQYLSNPAMSGHDPRALSEQILPHAQQTTSGGGAMIALLKLNSAGLLGSINPSPTAWPLDTHHTQAQAARIITSVIARVNAKADEIIEWQDVRQLLERGAIEPCWGFAMCYASQLLISHANGALLDPMWPAKIANMRAALDEVAKRWRIAERYCTTVQTAFDNRYGEVARPATSSAAASRRSSLCFETRGVPTGNNPFSRRTSA
ncbi:hypothetical protein VTJ49DRAFT_6199 [Mycothermus thermophilus]|uniref:Xylanolytic transcriptional activator regulatory domain-containing protein n=1 Tax=Humicola insolens TaxID=85995 RepID=A0ABR3V2T0_HUMIN